MSDFLYIFNASDESEIGCKIAALHSTIVDKPLKTITTELKDSDSLSSLFSVLNSLEFTSNNDDYKITTLNNVTVASFVDNLRIVYVRNISEACIYLPTEVNKTIGKFIRDKISIKHIGLAEENLRLPSVIRQYDVDLIGTLILEFLMITALDYGFSYFKNTVNDSSGVFNQFELQGNVYSSDFFYKDLYPEYQITMFEPDLEALGFKEYLEKNPYVERKFQIPDNEYDDSPPSADEYEVEDIKLPDLSGAIVTDITGLSEGSELVVIQLKHRVHNRIEFFHYQDCCESVELIDFEISSKNLIGGEVLSLREETSSRENKYTHQTWTFYHFDTTKGSLWMRWFGESNGYYSERVTIRIYDNDGNYKDY